MFDALILTSTTTVDFLTVASGPALLAFIVWSGVIKNPPLWVTWREHSASRSESAKWEALALKGTYLAGLATTAAEEEKEDGTHRTPTPPS